MRIQWRCSHQMLRCTLCIEGKSIVQRDSSTDFAVQACPTTRKAAQTRTIYRRDSGDVGCTKRPIRSRRTLEATGILPGHSGRLRPIARHPAGLSTVHDLSVDKWPQAFAQRFESRNYGADYRPIRGRGGDFGLAKDSMYAELVLG